MSQYPGNDINMGIDRITGEPITLTRFDRARHTCVFGSSRTGKSKLVEHMCREDILHWPNDRCPMVVLDPHGTLYKNLMAFVVAEGLEEWPIIPVDLSRGDLVVSYNLLRRRGTIDPSVVCRSFVDAILYAWGQSNTNQTPRLATWLHTLLMLSYEREHTLTEALQIIANPDLRRLIVTDVQDLVVRSVIQGVEQLKEREFQDRVESTLYRINRFLSGQILRATFCQTGESLDMGKVLDEGQILLANLSIEGSHIHPEDASAFGSVMLSDLWNAATRRGKREEGELAPCYVYVDEFQNFVGPTIAKGLAEASGFGLHLHLINQWPSQLVLHGGEVGQLVLDSVLNNAQNKIIFKLEHPDDLEMMTRIMFRQSVDPSKIKDEIVSTAVVGYDLQYHKSFNRSATHGTSRTVQESHSYSHGRTVATTESRTAGVNVSHGTTAGTSEGESTGVTDSEGLTESDTSTRGHSLGQSESTATSRGTSEGKQWSSAESLGSNKSTAKGENRSQTYSFDPPQPDFQEQLNDYWNDGLNQEDEDAFKRKWASNMSMTQGDSASESEGTSSTCSTSSGGNRSDSNVESHSHSNSRTDSKSQSTGVARARSRSQANANQTGRSRSVQKSSGFSFAHSEGRSEAESEQESFGMSESIGESESHTDGEGLAPMLMPIMEDKVTSRQFRSVDEQLFEMSQLIDAQRVRQCFVRLASAPTPLPVFTPAMEPPETTKAYAEQKTTEIMKTLPFVLSFVTANQNVREREAKLLGKLLDAKGTNEPSTSRRRVHARIIKQTSLPTDD